MNQCVLIYNQMIIMSECARARVYLSLLTVSLNARCTRVGLKQKTRLYFSLRAKFSRTPSLSGVYADQHDVPIRSSSSDYQICRETSGQLLMKPKGGCALL